MLLGGAEGFCFLLRGVNDNRPQTVADAWPSQMWRTAANSKEFQAIAGFRGEGLTSQTLQFSLDGCSSPFVCKTDEILRLKKLLPQPFHSSTRAPEKITGFVTCVATSNLQNCLAMTGVSLYEVSVSVGARTWSGFFSEDWRNGFQSSRRDQIVFCFEFNAELRFCVTAM